jgi:nicotinamide-nucleotide amidase
MHRMWEQEVAPELLRRNPGSVLVTRTLKTAGIGEGTIDEMVSEELKSTNPSIGIYARQDGVHLRLAAKAPTEPEAWTLIRPKEEQLRRILGMAVWGADEDTFESIIVDMLKERRVTLASMESCTGGMLASTITDIAGSSGVFKGGLVSYQTELKIEWGVPVEVIEHHGVISDECARAMAKAARERTEASVGIGITCVAGPDTQEDKPVGTVHIALDAIWTAPKSVQYVYPQGRTAVKRRAVTAALTLLRQTLLEWQPGAVV